MRPGFYFAASNLGFVSDLNGITSIISSRIIYKQGTLIRFYSLDADIDTVYIGKLNARPDKWLEPLILEADYSTSSYIQQAGNTVLFKVGELIGPQSELYSENDRTQPVENDYNRGYYRELNIILPKDYTISNPEDISLKEEVKDENGKVIYLFDAKYELKGRNLKVIIDEYYDQIYYPLEKYDEFQKVINAAADWNKVVLVMEKSR